MAMWYVVGWKYNSNYTQQIDDALNLMADPLEIREDSSANEARAHGNPFLDVSSVIRHDSTAVMAGQMKSYKAEVEERAAGDEPAAGFGYAEMFEALPNAWDQNHGFHIIDIDDPELVEHGEAYVHEQLTSYIAEPLREGSDSYQSLPPYVQSYVDRNTVNALAKGWYTGLPAVFHEPLRQRLGFPYEWWGAPID
jgi:hypothetical protein